MVVKVFFIFMTFADVKRITTDLFSNYPTETIHYCNMSPVINLLFSSPDA